MKTETLVKHVINEQPIKAKEVIDSLLKQKIAETFKQSVGKK